MTVVPVAFSASAKGMIMHTKELLEYERPLIAINPTFTKLITSLRTAISDDLGKLSKEDTSYDNVLDAFRLALKGIKLVKKERLIEQTCSPITSDFGNNIVLISNSKFSQCRDQINCSPKLATGSQ
jgi:hypothetical protein